MKLPKRRFFMFVDLPKSGISSLFDFLLYIFHASRPSTCQLYKTGKKLMNLYLFRCPLPIICENYHLPTGNSSHPISEQLKAFVGMGWVNMNSGGGVTHTICRRQICKVFDSRDTWKPFRSMQNKYLKHVRKCLNIVTKTITTKRLHTYSLIMAKSLGGRCYPRFP